MIIFTPKLIEIDSLGQIHLVYESSDCLVTRCIPIHCRDGYIDDEIFCYYSIDKYKQVFISSKYIPVNIITSIIFDVPLNKIK